MNWNRITTDELCMHACPILPLVVFVWDGGGAAEGKKVVVVGISSSARTHTRPHAYMLESPREIIGFLICDNVRC